MKTVYKMKHRSSKRIASKLSTETVDSTETISTRTSRSRSQKSDNKAKVNTCYEYFKVKKSLSSPEDSKLRTAEAAKETCSDSLTPNQTQTKEGYFTPTRPRRLRYDSLKLSDVKHQGSPGLCIEDVRMLVEAQDSYDGGVNCYVCGKLYKSKVCFIKHIWEHTVYWNIFEGAKNHERVLAIQAAIIMYCGMASQTNGASISDLCNLLVTSPHSSEMKQEKDSGSTPNSDELNNSFLAMLSEVCAGQSPLVVENGKEKSDENAVGNSLHNGAPKYPEGVTLANQNASLDSCIQMPSTKTDECWGQPCSHIAYLLSEISLLSPTRAHATLLLTPPKLQAPPTVFSPPRPPSYPAEISTTKPYSYSAEIFPPTKPHSYATVYSAPSKSQTYPTIFPSPAKPQCYPTLGFPQPQPHVFPIFSTPLPKPQTSPNLASSLPVLMLTSLPASQLSSDACRGYTNSRYTSTETYGTLENNDASFVSPLKRKRED